MAIDMVVCVFRVGDDEKHESQIFAIVCRFK